jgi:transposase
MKPKETKKYYDTEGQESIDHLMFFKIMLVCYLININNDRPLLRYSASCWDVRLFIRYAIDEQLPWFSTISRTRQFNEEEVFLSLLKKVLSRCIDNGMVGGKRQAVDSAFV